MTLFRTVAKPLTLFFGNARVLHFPFPLPDGTPSNVIGRSFVWVARRRILTTPLVDPVAMTLSGDGFYATAPIAADVVNLIHERGAGYLLDWDVIETTHGASISRWTGELWVKVSAGLINETDAAPAWTDLPYAEIMAQAETYLLSERGAPGPGLEQRLKDLGDIPSAEPELARDKIRFWGAEGAAPHAEAAAGAATEAGQLRDGARDEADRATTQADRSELGASAALVGGKVWPTIMAGLGATAEGEIFHVETASVDYADSYRKVGGVAVPYKPIASGETLRQTKGKLDAAITQSDAIPPLEAPIWSLMTAGGQSAIDVYDGGMRAPGSDVNVPGMKPMHGAVTSSGQLVHGWLPDRGYALPGAWWRATEYGGMELVDNAGGVILRHDQHTGLVNAGLSARPSAAAVRELVTTGGQVLQRIGPDGRDADLDARLALLAPRNAPAASALPIATDGRTLTRWRAKLALGQGRVMIGASDSWGEKRRIPQQLANILRADYGNAGGGWISCSANLTSAASDLGPLDDASFTRSAEWALFDITDSQVLPANGCGHDGQALTTSSADAIATATFTGNTFTLLWVSGTGTMRYSIDGGAPVVLAGDGSGTLQFARVTGLSTGSHSVVIDTVGNTGLAHYRGLYYRTTGASGIELLKCGNSAQDSKQLDAYVATHFAPVLAETQPDVLISFLTTNCYRRAEPFPNDYLATLDKTVTAARSAVPDIGMIFVTPARSNGTAIISQSAYRDALHGFAISRGVEIYNMHDDWGLWAAENANGMWLDDLHVNDAGAQRVGRAIRRNFLYA